MRKSNNDSGLTARRSNRLLAAVLTVLCAVSAPALFAQTYTRLSERTIMGTARYVGMGGAMTAIGGDPSAVMDNPAGLGLYRRHEVMLTFDMTFDRTTQLELGNKGKSNIFMAPQASIVLSIPTNKADETGVLAYNFMFSYHRQHTFSRVLNAGGTNEASLGALFAATGDLGIPYTADRLNALNALTLQESGYINEYAFDWAMNVSNRWYWGLGIRVHSFTYGSEAAYTEEFDEQNARGQYYANYNNTSVLYTGAGCSFATGLIYRPASWARLGFSIETPSIGSLRESTSGAFGARTDSLRWRDAKNGYTSYSHFHMPLHISTSVAFQIGYYAMLSLQYDYRHMKKTQDYHSLRAGFEVIPVSGLYINGGYAYESTFARPEAPASLDPFLERYNAYSQRTRWTQYVSAALGYRGNGFIVQLGYQYRWQRLDLYAHENVGEPYLMRTDNHRIILTLGWHH